ncbi:hypothetical protein LC613_41935, partial [Nostoc sphaeroides CHAB 2801]|uniref:hypothetical protein n=1 Tax=Nostoc sphaeroides TaxID=446679 RepID=UPI001E2EA0D4
MLTVAKTLQLRRHSDSANTDIIMRKQLRCYQTSSHSESPETVLRATLSSPRPQSLVVPPYLRSTRHLL